MDPDMITLMWLIGGVLLMASEVMVPGLVVIFIGAAAVIVSGLRWLGLENLTASFLLWGVLSTALVLATRSVAEKLVKSEKHRASVNGGVEALGVEVDVVVTCREDSTEGRIRYQGTTWPATTISGEVPAGSRARLVVRDNLAWVVEPLEASASLDDTDARFRELEREEAQKASEVEQEEEDEVGV
jgi:membrane protein implicated in regulation of membrane protease activity